jgi:cbb3-type cytochrome oxidase subunit 3
MLSIIFLILLAALAIAGIAIAYVYRREPQSEGATRGSLREQEDRQARPRPRVGLTSDWTCPNPSGCGRS